ncbi:methionine--tRNA ligase [Candidatus Wolfebacteria bacterium]|nr:methionine--tRNA ligase [Candidatus Wolfebacteria bacterium]
MISFEDFKKLDLRVAKIIFAERVENSEKLLKLKVDCGDKNEAGESVPHQIIAGIAQFYEPENLIDKEIVIVANLEPRTIVGLESQGMLLAVNCDGNEPILLIPEKPVPPGTIIR